VGLIQDHLAALQGRNITHVELLRNVGDILTAVEAADYGGVIIAATAMDIGISNRLIRTLAKFPLPELRPTFLVQIEVYLALFAKPVIVEEVWLSFAFTNTANHCILLLSLVQNVNVQVRLRNSNHVLSTHTVHDRVTVGCWLVVIFSTSFVVVPHCALLPCAS
jgi:hypothetical protein